MVSNQNERENRDQQPEQQSRAAQREHLKGCKAKRLNRTEWWRKRSGVVVGENMGEGKPGEGKLARGAVVGGAEVRGGEVRGGGSSSASASSSRDREEEQDGEAIEAKTRATRKTQTIAEAGAGPRGGADLVAGRCGPAHILRSWRVRKGASERARGRGMMRGMVFAMPPAALIAMAGAGIGAAACGGEASACQGQEEWAQLRWAANWGGPVKAVEPMPGREEIALVASGQRMLILDYTDEANPVELGSIDLGSQVYDIKVRGELAYVGTRSQPNNFCVIDVSDLSAPRLIWRYDYYGHAYFASEVDLYGDIAYIGHGEISYDAFDISDPRAPKWAGLRVSVRGVDMEIHGDLMYAGEEWGWRGKEEGGGRLAIYDLAGDPLEPALIGAADFGDMDVIDIAVEGTIAYVVTRDYYHWKTDFSGLYIVDVSDPTAPLHRGFIQISDAFNVAAAKDGKVCVSGRLGDAGPYAMYVVDASDPMWPSIEGMDELRSVTRGLEFYARPGGGGGGSGGRVFVSDHAEGLVLCDVEDLRRPARVSTWHSPASLRRMAKRGDLLYVVDAWKGFTVLDVSGKGRRAPRVLGVYESPEAPKPLSDGHWDIRLSPAGDLVYFTGAGMGLQVVDVTDPAAPEFVGSYGEIGEWLSYTAVELDPTGTVAWVGRDHSSRSGVVALDVSDPANMVEVGEVMIPGKGVRTLVLHEAAGVLHATTGYSVLAIDAGTLEVLSTQGAPEIPFPTDVAIDGEARFVSSDMSRPSGGGLFAQDVSDPRNPALLGSIEASWVDAVAVAPGKRVYATGAFDDSSILIVDTQTGRRSAPVMTSAPGEHLLVDEPMVFMTAEDTGLSVFDLIVRPIDVFGSGR